MHGKPERPEITHTTSRLIVGVIAISLAALTGLLSGRDIDSISASYHAGGLARDIFVGFLFTISAFLFAYNGKSTTEMVLSKVAAVAGIGIAVFPCRCGRPSDGVPPIHGISAAVMFIILTAFCYIFFRSAYKKGHRQARIRAGIYAICGLVIAGSILANAINKLMGGPIERMTYIGEAAGLVAFGIAWLTASQMLPIVTSIEERISFSPFGERHIPESSAGNP